MIGVLKMKPDIKVGFLLIFHITQKTHAVQQTPDGSILETLNINKNYYIGNIAFITLSLKCLKKLFEGMLYKFDKSNFKIFKAKIPILINPERNSETLNF